MQLRSINMNITFIMTYTSTDKASLSMFAVEVVNFRTDLIMIIPLQRIRSKKLSLFELRMMQQRNRNLWEFYLKNVPNTDYIWVKLHEIKNL